VNGMRIFVAGGSGTIGMPLVRALVNAGHTVTALTRSRAREGELKQLGASVAIADALDREALVRAVVESRPTHVVHQLTALPKNGPAAPQDLVATNRLRIDGTRNLLDAAAEAGAHRVVVGSFALLSPRDGLTPSADAGAVAVRSMEEQVLDATSRGTLEGVILRYGLFYGVDVPSTAATIAQVRKRRIPVVRGDVGELPVITVADAVGATVLALDRAPAGAVYDIVDDHPVSLREIVETIAEFTGAPEPWRVPAWLARTIAPYRARLVSVRMPVSNGRAKSELGWRLQYPTIRDGLASLAA